MEPTTGYRITRSRSDFLIAIFLHHYTEVGLQSARNESRSISDGVMAGSTEMTEPRDHGKSADSIENESVSVWAHSYCMEKFGEIWF